MKIFQFYHVCSKCTRFYVQPQILKWYYIPYYVKDLELDILENIFLLCDSRRERQAAAKDAIKEGDEAKAIVAEKETSEESTKTEGFITAH